ncbi:MAG: DUF4150 domain-containing protein [Thermodesulfobacteriota bacterium]
MGVTIHVNGTSNSLVHKGSMGIAKSTVPDVCKTPSPGGPVPVPYPVIISMSSDLAKGTKSVKADGGNSAAIKGSEFSRCMGDEPGTAGGVKSSTNMKEATWLLYSFDVKLEGKNACRLSDKMMMNHANSACLMGVGQQPVEGDDLRKELCKIIKQCEKEENAKARNKGGDPESEAWCDKNKLKLGEKKSKCAEEKIKKKQKEGKIGEEVKPEQTIEVKDDNGKITGKIRPDVIVGDPPNCSAVFDFKTSCPPKKGNDFEPNFPIYNFKMEFLGVNSLGRKIFQIALDKNLNPIPSDKFRKPPNIRYHGMRQDQIYEDVCGAECVALHPQGRACADA